MAITNYFTTYPGGIENRIFSTDFA